MPAPTTVPLMRMNCRSRPSSSSSWFDVSAASHRSMVPVLHVEPGEAADHVDGDREQPQYAAWRTVPEPARHRQRR
jgi:hypothetical protein